MSAPRKIYLRRRRVSNGKDTEARAAGIIKRSVFIEVNRLGGALVDTSPAFDAVFWASRVRSISDQLVDFAGADVDAVLAAGACFDVYDRIHSELRFQNQNAKEILKIHSQAAQKCSDARLPLS